MTTIDIHEFSTGINVKGTKDNWYSNGFTGYYLNSTLANFPEAVRQEIAADLFKLAETSIQKTSALIGREVKLGNEQWSVLAVVNSAWDESKRWITITRFFITEGLGKLVDLLTYQQTNNLKFDPFDRKQLNQPNKYNTNNTREIDILPIVFDDYSSIVNNLLANPLIVSTRLTNKNQKIPIKAIHQLAQEKANITSSSKLVTWAYNVEGLKKPHDCLVIYSASPQADKYLQQSLQVKRSKIDLRQEEYQILTIIRNWMVRFEIQIDDIKKINSALIDPINYNEDFWKQLIFNNLGIKDINDQYNPYNIRLCLLYSLIFPKELSNFLKWLHKKNNGKNLNAEHYQIAIEFSQKLQSTLTSSNQLEPLQTKAFQEIDVIITNLVNLKINIDDLLLADWLILDQMGIWGQVYHQFYKKELWNDIEQIAINKQNLSKINQQLSLLNTKSWAITTQDLTALINNQNKYPPNPKYLPLAQFFETLGDDGQSPHKINYVLSAIFYSLATGFVPNSLWKKIGISLKKVSFRLKTISRKDVGIITIRRKLTQAETFTRNLSTIISSVFKPISIPLILLPILALLAGTTGYTAGYQVKGLQMSHCKTPNLASTVISKIPLIGVNCSDTPSPEELTVAALNQIVKDNKDYFKVNETESQATIIELLDPTGKGRIYNLDFQQIELKKWLLFWHSPGTQNSANWTYAIRGYQQQAIEKQRQARGNKKLRLNPTGEIKQGDSTDQYLRCELQRNLQLNSKPEKIEQCRKYGVTGLTPEPTNPLSDLRPTPLPSVSPTTRTSSPSPTPTLPTDSGSQTFIDGGDMGSADWPTTSKALDVLRDEIANAHKLSKDKVGDAIIEALSLRANYKYKNGYPKVWIEGIQKFQEKTNNYSAYGFITMNDPTYNLLKCEVAKNLKISLKRPPAECSSNP
jgi:hypothetical protein